MSQEEAFMQRALHLAKNGIGRVSPNPMVGCVMVKSGKIISEGWHRAPGSLHAEAEAAENLPDPSDAEGADVYVTLEPCSHFGKTPPCADLLTRLKVKRVFVACLDPNPLVAGKGINKLIKAGIEVKTGVLEAEARRMNRRFLTFFEKKRPYIILKWAQTQDGFIARENFDSKWISSKASRMLVHKWRSDEDAIMVGQNTVIYDRPRLNTRHWPGKSPRPVLLLDDKSAVPADIEIMSKEETIIFERQGADFELFTENVLHELFKSQIQSVFVEGGAQVLRTFLKTGLWDEARVFTSPVFFEKGIAAPRISGKPKREERIDTDRLFYFQNEE